MTIPVTLDTFLSEARLRQGLEAAPNDATLLREVIGLCLLKGQMDEAVLLSGRLLAVQPDDPEALQLHATALIRAGRSGEAEQPLLDALSRSPGGGEAGFDLARLAEERQDWEAALAAYLPCAERDLGNQRAMLGVVGALTQLRRYDEAARALAGLCVHEWPPLGDRLIALADLLRLARRPEDALAVSRTARLLYPDNGVVAEQMARSLVNAGHPEDGLREGERAEALGRRGFSLHLTRSAAFHLLGRLDEALAEADRALDASPSDVTAATNQALVLMAQGRWDDGRPGYDRRIEDFPLDAARLWQGEEMDGTLLLVGEQGLGDQVQCLRYIPLIRPRVKGMLVVQLADPLLRLARGSIAGVDEWRSAAEPFGQYDRVIPMMSLMRVLDGGRPGTVPVPVPFLFPPAQSSVPLPDGPGLKVGLCWAGGPGYLLDSIRSMPAAEIGRLVRRFPQITFYRLQRGPVSSHVGEVRPDLPLVDAVGACADYADTAAVISRLDLVISVDTSLAHVAAALGKETWILIPHVACFRWGQTGEKSALYPTAHLIRQPRYGEGWGETMDEVADRLHSRLSSVR